MSKEKTSNGANPDVEALLDKPNRLSWKKTTELIIAVRRWFTHEKAHLDHTHDEINIRRVFDVNLHDTPPTEHEAIWKKIFLFSYDEAGSFFYYWTLLVFLGCFYNLVMIVVMIYEEVSKNFHRPWIIGNIIFDVVFLIDWLLLTRREFIDGGVRVSSVKDMLLHRLKSKEFYMDFIAVMPTDLMLFHMPDFSMCRLNRLLKLYRVSEFNALTEIRTDLPTLFRLSKLVFLCFIIFHWNGCIYFFLSVIYDFKNATIDDWIFSYDKIPNPIFVECDIFRNEHCDVHLVTPLREFEDHDNLTHEVEFAMSYWNNRTQPMEFSNFVKQYGLSFYWSALTLVTLGEQPWPNTTFQCSFEIADTLLGLVIFAVIVGDVGNMVQTMNSKKTQFEEVLDGSKAVMIRQKVQHDLQTKILRYFDYTWTQGQHGVNEEEISDFLPNRLYGQMAVHIHMETLRRVKLFEECEANLLYELILKLELQVYSPMDYICRKGEVGKEMYIVKSGFVEVVNDDGSKSIGRPFRGYIADYFFVDNNRPNTRIKDLSVPRKDKVFVRLGEGVVFGELSILNIPGNKNGNRRTANVRSAGYTDLYALKKEDLWDALREYPDAKLSLLAKGKQILAKDNLLDESLQAEDDWDPDAPVEEQLSIVEEEMKDFMRKLEEAEKKIHTTHTAQKQRLTQLEQEMVDIVKEDKAEVGESHI